MFAIIGLVIFYSIIMVKIDLAAKEADAKLKKISADVSWHGFLYKKTMDEILESQKAQVITPDTR